MTSVFVSSPYVAPGNSLKRLMDSGTISGQEAYMQAFDKKKFEEHKDFS